MEAVLAAATLGPALVADAFSLDELLGGAFEELALRYVVQAEQVATAASNIVGTFIGEFRAGAADQLAAAQAGHIRESAEYLIREANELARARLFDAALIQSGDLVPAGFVRAITAVAGGTTDVTISGHAYVALTAHGTRSVPGLATGPDIMETLDEHGASVEAYRWVYGPAQRGQPFPPHRRLDGVAFINFDDPKLANTTGFPPFSHYMPGDHDGCRCDFEPIILTAEQARAAGLRLPEPPKPEPTDESGDDGDAEPLPD